MRWNQNTKRRISYFYGWGVLENFLDQNNFKCLIRAHEVKAEGHEKLFYNQKDAKYAKVYTVFSAPNYCDIYSNKASVLVIGKVGFDVI
jgi:serine/threonine-protein phosphatase 2B catalytic subunit